MEGVRSLSEAKSVLDSWEPSNALAVTSGRGKSRWEPEFDILGAISEQEWVDIVEEGFCSGHVETLRGMEVVDARDESPAGYCERVR